MSSLTNTNSHYLFDKRLFTRRQDVLYNHNNNNNNNNKNLRLLQHKFFLVSCFSLSDQWVYTVYIYINLKKSNLIGTNRKVSKNGVILFSFFLCCLDVIKTIQVSQLFFSFILDNVICFHFFFSTMLFLLSWDCKVMFTLDMLRLQTSVTYRKWSIKRPLLIKRPFQLNAPVWKLIC